MVLPAQLGIQIWIRNWKANCKLSKTNVLDTVSIYITEVTLEWQNLKKMIWFPSSERFNQYLCSNAFKLFKENCPHSYKKQKDGLKTRAVLLIFSFELEISGVAVQRIHSKQWKMLAFVRNSSVKMILRLF